MQHNPAAVCSMFDCGSPITENLIAVCQALEVLKMELADSDKAGRELAALEAKRQLVEQFLDKYQLTPEEVRLMDVVSETDTFHYSTLLQLSKHRGVLLSLSRMTLPC
jgi:hypothetical protein